MTFLTTKSAKFAEKQKICITEVNIFFFWKITLNGNIALVYAVNEPQAKTGRFGWLHAFSAEFEVNAVYGVIDPSWSTVFARALW